MFLTNAEMSAGEEIEKLSILYELNYKNEVTNWS